jgi:hypothetical protein
MSKLLLKKKRNFFFFFNLARRPFLDARPSRFRAAQPVVRGPAGGARPSGWCAALRGLVRGDAAPRPQPGPGPAIRPPDSPRLGRFEPSTAPVDPVRSSRSDGHPRISQGQNRSADSFPKTLTHFPFFFSPFSAPLQEQQWRHGCRMRVGMAPPLGSSPVSVLARG